MAADERMLTGFNTDIEHEGVTYHVQTEDRGLASSLIESLVYVRGEILANRRTEYRNLVDAGADQTAIRTLMERQHRAIVDTIRGGRIDVLTDPAVADEGDTTISRRNVLRPAGNGGDGGKRAQRSLDEVIGDWLAEQQKTERIKLHVEGGDALRFAAPFTLKVGVTTSPGGAPIAHAHVVVRMLSTVMKAVKLGEAHTDANGGVELAGELPAVEKGTGLVVVTVQHPSGNDEVKFLVQR